MVIAYTGPMLNPGLNWATTYGFMLNPGAMSWSTPPLSAQDQAGSQRYRKLLVKGKNHGVVITAVGRELLDFIWAIGMKVETAQEDSLQRAA